MLAKHSKRCLVRLTKKLQLKSMIMNLLVMMEAWKTIMREN